MVKQIIGGLFILFLGIAAIDSDNKAIGFTLITLGVLSFIVPLIIKQKQKRDYNDWLQRNYSATMQEVDEMNGVQFEEFCAALLIKNNYNVSYTKASGDQGVDLIASKDDIRIAIQCKRHSNNLGNTPVQEVYTGSKMYKCNKAAVMTNSYFTKGAKEAAKATGVILIDRGSLIDMLTENK